MPPTPLLPNLTHLGVPMNFLSPNGPHDLSMFAAMASADHTDNDGGDETSAYHDVTAASYLGLPYDPLHEGETIIHTLLSSDALCLF